MFIVAKVAPTFSRINTGYLAFLAVFILALVLPGQLHCQTPSSGALAGVVFDPSGAVLPGVAVRVTNRETGVTALTGSDEQGRFNFLLLSPGKYEVQASSTGFEAI